MFTRLTGLVIVPFWLTAMGWLFAHDIWPTWAALEPPPIKVNDWLRSEGLKTRYLISDELGPVGTIWTTYLIDESTILRDDLVWIERLPFDVSPLRINAESVFTATGLLDEFTVRLEAGKRIVVLHGERFHSEFSFTLTTGAMDKAFKIPLTDAGMIGAAFNPFSQLSDLRVGQRWRMQVFNPISVLTGLGDRFIPMLMEVTGRERISTPDGVWNCLVVESQNAKAWVDERGAVRLQEMELPLVGRLRIARVNDFDESDRDRKAKFRLWDSPVRLQGEHPGESRIVP